MAETSSNAARTATVIMCAVLVGVVVWWLRGILTPFALALFLMVIIDGLARVLEHRIPYFPKKAALPTALVLTTAVLALVIYAIANEASGFVTQLIVYMPKLKALAVHYSGQLGIEAPQSVGQLLSQLNLPHYISIVATAFEGAASGAAFVFVYLIFLIIARAGFEEKAHLLFERAASYESAKRAFVRMRTGIERYVWVQTLCGAMIAAGSWALMQAVGLNNALFWGFLIFAFCYVPIIGGAVAVLLPPVFALAQFGGYEQALILLIGAELIHVCVGNFVAPRLQARSLNVDPLVVVLSLAFWGAVWGVPGTFLSTPLTVAAIVILVQFPNTRWIAVLLSRDGDPETYTAGPQDPSEPPRPAAPRRARRREPTHS
jgi:predicted PurR-regulated permease PerM